MHAAAMLAFSTRIPTWWQKQETIRQCAISAPVDLVLQQITQLRDIKTVQCASIKCIDFRDQRVSHNYDNSQWLRN